MHPSGGQGKRYQCHPPHPRCRCCPPQGWKCQHLGLARVLALGCTAPEKSSPSDSIASWHRKVTEGDVNLTVSFSILFLPEDKTTIKDCGLPSSTVKQAISSARRTWSYWQDTYFGWTAISAHSAPTGHEEFVQVRAFARACWMFCDDSIGAKDVRTELP